MERFLYRCERVLTYTAVLSIFIMMCLTTTDAIGRYFFSRPITGAYELTEKYFMLITIFLGIAFAYRGGAFIRVGILMDRMPMKVKVPINYFGQIFSIVYGAVLVFASIQQLVRTFQHGTTLASLPFIPLWPGIIVIPIGLLLMCLLMLFDLPRVKKGKSALFQDETPTL
jgi:TRAP-type C4-dicarboxylate transport system permease small subunit